MNELMKIGLVSGAFGLVLIAMGICLIGIGMVVEILK